MTEREKFEKWYGRDLKREPDGDRYKSERTQFAWEVWETCADNKSAEIEELMESVCGAKCAYEHRPLSDWLIKLRALKKGNVMERHEEAGMTTYQVTVTACNQLLRTETYILRAANMGAARAAGVALYVEHFGDCGPVKAASVAVP